MESLEYIGSSSHTAPRKARGSGDGVCVSQRGACYSRNGYLEGRRYILGHRSVISPCFKHYTYRIFYEDPAYPPSRQIIYLRVAQPRALIVLKGAGTIGSSVREFLSTELKIRVEVPALELLEDGTIMGGSSQGADDVLNTHRDLANTDPNVALGPDSVGTLSFTSGSTGIPKGVKGRHYSLTHFFPWMGETFGIGPQSKFTMLSGIAHDPIQRVSKSPLPSAYHS